MAAALGLARPSPPTTIVMDIVTAVPEMSCTDVTVAKAFSAFCLSRYTNIAASVRKRQHSSTMAWSSKKRRLVNATATATATAEVKREKVLKVMEAAE